MSEHPRDVDREEVGVEGLQEASLVGRGGAAVVYKATQVKLQRTVAVKLLTSSWDEAVARRFDREQRAMGRLSGRPGIVPVYESGLNDNGVPYIVMPYYENGSLKDWTAREGPMPWEQATNVILEVAEAVGRAHDEGIVHRDLKPANILLSGSGKPLLADFGIARLASDGTGLDTTAVTFTPAYCPPEVMDEADADPRADTYSLAATYWALIEGRAPFTDSNTSLAMEAVLKRVLTEPPPRLSGVPDSVADFVEQAMSKEPSERPADGQAFADHLRAALAESSRGVDPDLTVARAPRKKVPAPAIPPDTPKAGRRAFAAVLAIGAVVALGAAAVGIFLTGRESDSEPQATEPSTLVVPAGTPIALLPIAPDSDSATAVEVRRATQLAVLDFGDIGDFRVETLETVTVGCAPTAGESLVSAVTETNAAIVVGSSCFEAAAPIMQYLSTVDVSWIAPNMRWATLTANFDGTVARDHIDGFFRTSSNAQFEGTVAGLFADQDLGATSAVVLVGDNSGYPEIAEAFVAAFGPDKEIEFVQVADDVGPGVVADALSAANADVSFWVLDTTEARELAERADDSRPRIGIADLLDDGTAATGSLVDMFVVTPQTPLPGSASVTGRTFGEVRQAYFDEYGEAPEDDLLLASSYDAAVLALRTIASTGAVADDDFVVERPALRLGLEAAEADGLAGRLSCNIFGDCGSQALMIVQIDGISASSTVENIVKFFGEESG